MRFKAQHIIILLAVVIAVGTSCKKTSTLTNGGVITFSVDTLAFDTVFTAAGSFTASFKIFNPQSEDIILSAVHLQKGTSSFFHLNVDGFQGNTQTNLKIRAHDSIYVFATVNIDPTNTANPFVIVDSFIANMNGKNFILPFTAYGQNAHYIVDSVLEGTHTWGKDDNLPYVILQNALVDSAATLTIAHGTRVYVNQDSRLFVLGTLHIEGTATDSVIFQGDRLDRAYFGYEGYPGEWGGIYFTGQSIGNTMSYTILKNCGGSTNIGANVYSPAAIEVDSPYKTAPNILQLTIDHCIIENSLGYGILSYGGCIHADNCRINTCGAQALALIEGGYDTLNNCTFVCYGTDKVDHTDNGTVAILNYYAYDDTHYYSGNLNAVLNNCIIWGGLSTEFLCDSLPGGAFNFSMQNCLYRADSIPRFASSKLNSCIANLDPMFKNPTSFDFHISMSSPAAGKGTSFMPYFVRAQTDLDGNAWALPMDIGCYKAQ